MPLALRVAMKTLIVPLIFWFQVLSPVALASRLPASEAQSLYVSMSVQDIWSFQGPLQLMGQERVVTTSAFLENHQNGKKMTFHPAKEVRSFEAQLKFVNTLQAQYEGSDGDKHTMKLKTRASLYTGIKNLDLQAHDSEKILVSSLDRQVQKVMNEFLIFENHSAYEKQRSVTGYRCSRVESALICSGRLQIEYRLIKKSFLAQK